MKPDAVHPFDSLKLEEAYRALAQDLDDQDSHRAGDAYLAGTNALYHGGPVQWSFVPKVFSRRDVTRLAAIAERMGSIMEKVTDRFAHDPAFRARFGLDPVIEELSALEVPYTPRIPIARVDIFLNERTGDFAFCELNTDGSSGMLVTQEVSRANLLTATGASFARAHAISTFPVLESCCEAVIGSWRAAGGVAEHPVFAAVDYAESIVREEIREFERVFAEHGATLRFADIRDLRFEAGILFDSQGPLDGVWRRVVVSEMLEKPCAGADALIACARAGKTPIIGGFATWPCATKTVFAVLRDREATSFLTEEDHAFIEAHVPATFLIDTSTDLTRFSDRARWIAKPRDGYNSIGVRAGCDCTEGEWQEVLAQMARTGGTVQEYVVPFAVPNVEGGVEGMGRAFEDYYTMEGLFLFQGRFGGVFTRCGQAAVIGEFTGRLNMGCLMVDESPRER